ncbi:class I SAM-dependent methyltransferase [Marinilongibacter aquaticus]|uniref:class I SAM-dependent methyltransferase n=1 Tax=Marinilongibacter aquaticus TaxID=2975157 RepID=UPI0021BD5438|nr:class I SAM-dependent methyltransferase [Marinilongibacter aquaticus]UBM60632.1 class I SAM-dependent methyltransferase [Marinilongibacter aquaticus]
MKLPKDKFSDQAETYKKFRPKYPDELIAYIVSLCSARERAWDCGTGNGQVALALAHDFSEVKATDISEKQLQKAESKSNVDYSLCRAEATNFPDAYFDLITVAQALHWFDFEAFSAEAFRVLKPEGLLAVWGYGLLRVDREIDEKIDWFYAEKVGEYWDAERRHIEQKYASIPFRFEELSVDRQFSIRVHWSLEHVQGYFNSWSSVQNFIAENGENPVVSFMEELKPIWGDELRAVEIPIFMKVGRKNSPPNRL